jgi:hypothetical protein
MWASPCPQAWGASTASPDSAEHTSLCRMQACPLERKEAGKEVCPGMTHVVEALTRRAQLHSACITVGGSQPLLPSRQPNG